MDLIISLLMGTRFLGLFGGGLGHDVAVSFGEPLISVTREEIRLDCGLRNAFPEELRNLIATATPVYVYVFVEFHDAGRGEVVQKTVAENRVQYDMVAKRCCVVRSTAPDSLCYSTLDSVMGIAGDFRGVTVARKSSLRKDASYTVTAYAVLGKTLVEALGNREIDCMFYWDYKRPSFETEKITGRQLLEAGER